MRVYYIEKPYLSKGLKRSYKKKLEVFSGEVIEGKYYPTLAIDCVYKYNDKKKEWVKQSCGMSIRYIENAHRTSLPSVSQISSHTTFATLELAQAAKLLAIEKMSQTYKENLRQIQELFERNVPDVKELISEMSNDYPEYFV